VGIILIQMQILNVDMVIYGMVNNVHITQTAAQMELHGFNSFAKLIIQNVEMVNTSIIKDVFLYNKNVSHLTNGMVKNAQHQINYVQRVLILKTINVSLINHAKITLYGIQYT
jgi:hypothetical protein